MRTKISIILAVLLFSSSFLFSQNDKKDIVLEDLIEDIAANSDEELDYSEIYDDLYYYMNNKLNLNTASESDLEKLHFLDQIQIDSILYLQKHGGFVTETDLYMLGFSQDEIETLMNFATIGNKEQKQEFQWEDVFKWGRHDVFLRSQVLFEPQKGYNIPDSVIEENPDKSRYLGSPLKLYTRYKFHYKDYVQWGFTAEKDPGEQFFKGAQKYGFDFYSAHLQLDKVYPHVKRIVVGDYQAQFGEGLTMWTGLTFGKSAIVTKVKKNGRGLRRYTSTDENNFLRGVGGMFEFGNFTVTAFGSYHKIDANISDFDSLDTDIEIRQISSIQNTGYHRTPSEILDKHAIGETVFGGNVTYRKDNFITGLTFVDYNFSAELNKDLKPYEIYKFQGNSNFNAGWNYDFILYKFHIFGETSISQNGGLATIDGVFFSPDQRIKLVSLYRNYSPKYQALMSGALSEGSDNQNERGIYWGMELYPYKKFKVSAYVDAYTFPWLSYRLYTPKASGYEYFTQVEYNPNYNVSMYLRFKHEIKPQNVSYEDIPIKYPADQTRWNLRYHISFQVTETVTLRDRIEFSRYEKDGEVENGFMIFQDVKFKPKTIPLTLYFRYAMFDAPYDARIYAYENDVLYAFSVPGYFYQGFRTYVVAKYDITKSFTAWLKLSQFNYSDRTVLSEGSLNEIDGHTKTELKIELRYRF